MGKALRLKQKKIQSLFFLLCYRMVFRIIETGVLIIVTIIILDHVCINIRMMVVIVVRIGETISRGGCGIEGRDDGGRCCGT